MTKFEKFAEFIMQGVIYPLVITFVTCLLPVVIYFTNGAEVMWLVNLGGVFACITAVWLVLFLVVFTAVKIIEWREDIRWRKENAEG